MGVELETIFNIEFDDLSQSTINLTESFNNLKALIDKAKSQMQKEKTNFVAKFLENK